MLHRPPKNIRTGEDALMEEDYFRDYHLYRRAVRRDLAKPLTHFCGTEYVAGFGPDDEFALNCYTCDTQVIPGLIQLDRIKAVARNIFK